MSRETGHLEMIQAVITRMAGNSFQMKGWSVALASAVTGFAASKESHLSVAAFTLVPAGAFWALDAYYLALERLYRALYNKAVTQDPPTYLMNVGPVSPGLWASMLSRPAVAGIHIPMIVVIALVSLTGVLR
jgi:hypothetical protein